LINVNRERYFKKILTDIAGIGIGNEQLLLSLLFFNSGIEAGQFHLIPIFSFAVWMSRRFNFYSQSATCASLVIDGMGFFWFIERTVSLISIYKRQACQTDC
jgi:hypothetical protein